MYEPWYTVAVLSCIEEHNLCNPALPNMTCSQFAPTSFALNTSISSQIFANLQLSPRQRTTTSRLLASSLIPFNLGTMVSMMGNPLIASKTLDDSIQLKNLPQNHWRSEVGRWFSINLSLIQSGFVEYVTGPADPTYRQNFTTANFTRASEDCANQVFRNAIGVQNFNLAAISIVMVIGLCFIGLGLTLESLVGWFQKRVLSDDTARLRWLLDGFLQQQRLAYEAVGVTHWQNLCGAIPTTDETSFPPIDSCKRDPLHPRLYHSTKTKAATRETNVSKA